MQKLIRHSLAAFAAWLIATHNIEVDVSSTASLALGLVMLAASFVWSIFSKDPITATNYERVRIIAAAFIQQGLAALAGYLHASGHPVSVENPEALLLFAGNYGVSKLARPDAKLPSVEELQRTGLLICALLLPFGLLSCTTEGKGAAMAFGKQLAIAAAQVAVDSINAEIRAEMAKPKPDQAKLWSLQLAAVNAQQQLDQVRAKMALNSSATPLIIPPNNPLLPPPVLPSGKAVIDDRLW